MQHSQNPFYNESDTSAADQIERVGPIANIFFNGNKMMSTSFNTAV